MERRGLDGRVRGLDQPPILRCRTGGVVPLKFKSIGGGESSAARRLCRGFARLIKQPIGAFKREPNPSPDRELFLDCKEFAVNFQSKPAGGNLHTLAAALPLNIAILPQDAGA
jgi:hypothetical protein